MSEYLTLHEEPGELRRPVIIMAFSGWNDAAESAPGLGVEALRHHRPGRFLPLRPVPALCPVQDRLPDRA
jgi:hypothetical protein